MYERWRPKWVHPSDRPRTPPVGVRPVETRDAGRGEPGVHKEAADQPPLVAVVGGEHAPVAPAQVPRAPVTVVPCDLPSHVLGEVGPIGVEHPGPEITMES